MQTLPRGSNHQAHTTFLTPRLVRCLVAAAFIMACTSVSAGGNKDAFDSFPATDMTPWMPEVIQAIDEYVVAPGFNGGRLGLDHFADSSSLDQQGLVTAKLANGDMVVAGLVPDGVGGGFCGDGTKLCSIGLVRYSPTGQRITWPNAGANGRYSNNYVVYPGAPSNLGYQYLRDIKVRGTYIDVLVDEPDWNHPALTLGHRNVAIVTFAENGSFKSRFGIFGVAPVGAVEYEDFYGAQMVHMNSTQMIVAATVYDSIGPYIAVTRLAILANGAVSLDSSWGIPYLGSSSFNSLVRYYAPGSYCGAAACDVTAGYVAKQEGFPVQTDFYVAGNLHISGNNWDPVALKISSANGSIKTEFNVTGWSRAIFDEANSSLQDLVAGLYVYQDDVYMAAQVARKCHDGIGLAKLNGATGGYIPAFGSGGKIVFGGQGNATICFGEGWRKAVPHAISATGGRIGVAGHEVSKNYGIPVEIRVDPLLAVVNAVNGTVLDIDSHPVTRPDGSRYGDGALYGIYGGPSATSPFVVSGTGRDASTGNTMSYLSGRLIPVSSDRIFANGFNN